MYKSGERRRPRCRKWGRKKAGEEMGWPKIIARMSLCRGCAVNRNGKKTKHQNHVHRTATIPAVRLLVPPHWMTFLCPWVSRSASFD